jgi:pyruvate formate lyase activating enzyme
MIGGIQPCSFIDFPGNIAAVLFLQGCNLRCRYCQNPQLMPISGERSISEADALKFLGDRKGRLTGVVVSGGEPTLQDSMLELLNPIRSMGFSIKIDTNGTRPDAVRRLVTESLIDYAAVDVKIAPGPASHSLCGLKNQAEKAAETLSFLVQSGIPCEARTTVVEEFHDLGSLEAVARMLESTGVVTWKIQQVEATGFAPPDPDILSQAMEVAAALGIDASVRPRAQQQKGRDFPIKSA